MMSVLTPSMLAKYYTILKTMNWKIYRWCLWCFLKLQHTSLPKLHGFSRPKALWTPSFGVFMEASLHRSHSSTLAWKIPRTEEPGRLQSMGSRRVGQDWGTSLSIFTFMHWRRKWQPTPVFLPRKSQGRRSLVGCRLWGHSQTQLKRLNNNSSIT